MNDRDDGERDSSVDDGSDEAAGSSSDEAGSETGEGTDRGASDEAGGTDDEAGNDGSDDGLPGFGAVPALVSIALAAAAGLARRS